MKKKLVSKILSCALVVAMVFGMVACGSKEETSAPAEEKTEAVEEEKTEEVAEEEVREEVELVWYLHAVNVGPGLDAMTEAANAYLKEKLNTTVDFHYFPQSEYKQTVNTIFNSGTYMDIVTVANTGVDFDSNVARGAFVDLTDYIDEYLPVTTSLLPNGAYEAFAFEGRFYAVPPVKDLVLQNGFIVNNDMLADLGVEFPDPATYGSLKDLEDFFYEVREAKNAKYPDDKTPLLDFPITFGDYFETDALLGSYAEPVLATTIEGLTEFEGVDNHYTVFNVVETPQFLEWAKSIQGLVANNIRSFDEETYDQDQIQKYDGSLLGTETQGSLYFNETEYDFDGTLYLNTKPVCTSNYMKAGAMAISSQSEHVERALEVIEFMNVDEYFATVVRFGPEGEGWTDEDNNGIVEMTEKNSDSANRWWYCWYGWITGGLATTKTPEGSPENFGELLAACNQAGYASSHLSFAVDTTEIQAEYAAVMSVADQYNKILRNGQNENVEEIVAEYIDKLDAAGIDFVMAEYQKQLDAWCESQGITK